ncbi:MAG: DUF2917 domain-containing protein [Pseudomonadota bacterium]
MSTPLAPTTLRLERGQSTRLDDTHPTHLASAAGTLWITIDNDPRDIVLEAGQAIDLWGDVPVLVGPLGGPAVLQLSPVERLDDEPQLISVL